VRPFEAALHQYLSDEHKTLLERLETSPKFDAELEGALRGAITEFKDQYVKDNANVLAA
jgi:F0F1-type ATP synthase alpha subunit